MVWSDVVRAALMFGAAATIATDGPAPIVYALVALSAVASTVFRPAKSALLPALVSSPGELTAANAASSTLESVGMFLGPALGGALLAVSSPSVVFAANGLAGARLEAIAARAGISHPRIVQMFGTKQKLFLEVVQAAFDRIEAAFDGAGPTLVALGNAYVRLLRRDRTVGLVVLQGYAAAADETVREAVRHRHLGLMDTIARLIGADAQQVRTFFATGLVQTVSVALELPGGRADTAWSGWILGLVDPAGRDPSPMAGGPHENRGGERGLASGPPG